MSLGERFRAAREQRGLSLSEVAEHLRIRSVYLAAIEEENWGTISAPVYTRGFLRTYARYLGVDAEEAVAEFNQATGQPLPGTAPVQPTGKTASALPAQASSLGLLLWLAGGIAIALIGLVVYLSLVPPRSVSQVASASPTPAAAVQPSPASSAATPPASRAAVAQTLAIHLTASCWLRVLVDGKVLLEGTFPAGTVRTFHGTQADVRVGNAGGVEIAIDGRSIGKLGGPGDVVEKSFVL